MPAEKNVTCNSLNNIMITLVTIHNNTYTFLVLSNEGQKYCVIYLDHCIKKVIKFCKKKITNIPNLSNSLNFIQPLFQTKIQTLQRNPDQEYNNSYLLISTQNSISFCFTYPYISPQIKWKSGLQNMNQ